MPTTLFNPWHGFPSANAVYVDLNYLRMRGNGQLAYPTLELAVAAWRVGGAAQVIWGTPTATNPGLILVGADTIPFTTTQNVDVNFLEIVGCGAQATLLSLTASQGNAILITVPEVTFRDLSINDLGNSTSNLIRCDVTGATTNCKFISCNLTDTGSSTLFSSTSAFSGEFLRCNFSFSGSVGAVSIVQTTFAGTYTGSWIDCLFAISGAGTASSFTMNAGQTVSYIIDRCRFTGDPTAAHIRINGDSHVFGRISNNFFTGTGIAINGAGGSLGTIVEGNTMRMAGVGIANTGAGALIVSNWIGNSATNGHAISGVFTGNNIRRNALIGNGTGLAIEGGVVTLEITHNELRMPTGNVAGSSVSATLVNQVANPFNSEIPN